MEFLELNSNTWNSLTVGLIWIFGLTEQYLELFDSEQMDE